MADELGIMSVEYHVGVAMGNWSQISSDEKYILGDGYDAYKESVYQRKLDAIW